MEWAINIERKNYTEPVDMETIKTALIQAGISPDVDEEMEKVTVGQYEVARATKVINGLGYETDEDN